MQLAGSCKSLEQGENHMINIRKLEAELWDSADLLRAGSKLTSNQYWQICALAPAMSSGLSCDNADIHAG